MSKPSIDVVWKRIRNLDGKAVRTYTDKLRIIRIKGDDLVKIYLDEDVVGWIRKDKIAKAIEMVPIERPKVIKDKMGRPGSYIWAILNDPRIKQNDWK